MPTWRPDKAMAVKNPKEYRAYLEKLSEVSGVTINKFNDLLDALHNRHDFLQASDVNCLITELRSFMPTLIRKQK